MAEQRSVHESDVFDYARNGNPDDEAWAARCTETSCAFSSSGHNTEGDAQRAADKHWNRQNRWAQP